MKILKVALSLLTTLALIFTLNTKWGNIPPLGKFLDPFHGFWKNAEGKVPQEEQLTLAGLKEEVTVYYDSMLIPHVFARNEEDLFLAQGFVTARHRLWQMEFQTHAGAGRISEILGTAALDYDRTQRRQGMVYAAEKAVEKMENNPVARLAVENYTRGINTYIRSLKYESLPFEYKLLDYEPEEWTHLKCALLLKNMAKTLNTGDKDFEMTNALKLFGKEALDVLYPDRENMGDPIVDRSGKWNFTPIRFDSLPLAIPKELVAAKPLEKSDKDVGSNNWALSGSKTATGAPLLCNDPHLSLSLPSIWYIIHLNAPGLNVMGASLPGAPSVISGFNDSIAWGVTNAQRDLVDWFKIEMKDRNNSEYLSDGDWKPVKKVVEKFRIKGAKDFYDTVLYTHHGPIVFDPSFHGDDEKSLYAYRWVSHDPSEELLTFYELNKARNHPDYMEALNHFASPAQNFAFAAVNGDIAMRIQGKYPVRRPEEGKFVLDGTTTSTEWKAFIPNDQNVMDLNPPRGFVSSANQYPVDSTYPYYITATSYEAYRNRRINQRLAELDSATVSDMMNLQFDTYNLKAAESLPVFISYLDSSALTVPEKKALNTLRAWNFFNDINSEAASYYEAWWDVMRPMIWDEMNNDQVALQYPTTYTTIQLIKDEPDFSFFDIVATPGKETAREVMQKSFKEGVASIEKWKAHNNKMPRWADFKDTYIGHLLRQEALSVHVEHGGNHDIVNASSRTHGPSWRMIVSLEKTGVKAWGIYPGGQSGNPGSAYYDNMISRWARGKYFNLPFTGYETIAKQALSKTTLLPAGQ